MNWYNSDSLVIYWLGGAGLEMALPYYIDLTDFSLSYHHSFQEMDANQQYWANIFISDFNIKTNKFETYCWRIKILEIIS